MSCSKRSVLLLDRNYLPIRTINWKRAIQLVLGRGKAEVLSNYDTGNEHDYSVIRLISRVFPANVFTIKAKFHRRQVIIRDNHKCVYCGYDRVADLTIDHIVPKSRGGPTTYANCVSACRKCNQRKGNRTPEEAMMTLSNPPTMPVRGIIINYFDVPSEWMPYLGRHNA